MRRKTVWVLAVFLVLAAAVFVSCSKGGGGSSGGDSGSGTVQLSGSVGNGYTVASAKPFSAFLDKILSPFVGNAYATLTGTNVDTVLAIQSSRGQFSKYSILHSKSAAINPDGSFSIILEKSDDWVLVLMNSNPTTTSPDERFVGYIAYDQGGGHSLLELPASAATITSYQTGTLNKNGDTAISSNTITAVDFSMTNAQMLTLAKNDDGFKSVKNFIINFGNYGNSSDVYYILRPDFSWHGDYSTIQDSFADPAAYSFNAYTLQMSTNSTEVSMDNFCGANGQPKKLIELYPPAGTSVSSRTSVTTRTYNDTNPLSNDLVTASSCTAAPSGATGQQEARDDDTYASDVTTGGGLTYSFYPGFQPPILPGYWTFKIDGSVRGLFDVAVAAPLSGTNQIIGFVPVPKLTTSNGLITKVDLKWYSFDETGAATELTDISVLKYLLGPSGVSFYTPITATVRQVESFQFDPATTTTFTPTKTWYYGSSGDANHQAGSLMVFYESAGIGHSFGFFAP